MDQVIDDLNSGSYDVGCAYESSDLVSVCDQWFYEDDHEEESDEAIYYDNEDGESFELYYYNENVLRILINHEYEVYYRFDASLLERLEMRMKKFGDDLRKVG